MTRRSVAETTRRRFGRRGGRSREPPGRVRRSTRREGSANGRIEEAEPCSVEEVSDNRARRSEEGACEEGAGREADCGAGERTGTEVIHLAQARRDQGTSHESNDHHHEQVGGHDASPHEIDRHESNGHEGNRHEGAGQEAPARRRARRRTTAATKAVGTSTAPAKAAPRRTPKPPSPDTPSILSNYRPDRHEIPAARGTSKDGITYTKDFDVKFLKAQRDELLARRASELARATRLEDEATSLIEDGEMGDVQFDDEGGEGDTMVVQRDLDRVLSTQARQTIADIDAALTRIEAGTYGYSEVSGLPIPRERLEALPETTVLAAEKVSGIGLR